MKLIASAKLSFASRSVPFAGGCQPEAETEPDVVVADSAGIPVVVNPAVSPDSSRSWRLAAAPSLELGMTDGPPEYLFDRAFSAAARVVDA